ncbi:MAG: cysteine--tRNA ligase [bacterium]
MSTEPKKFRVFDTMTDNKVAVEPVQPGKISMYVCGVTVYDLTHIGHARVFVFFDVVQRVLRHLGYDLRYVRNHTDVDDKIINRAAEVGEDPLALSQRFIAALDEDMGRLHVHHADVEPKVSDHIPQIVAMVEKLIERGHAYESKGDVYFRVQSFDSYGKLSHRKLEDMEAGRSGRVSDDEDKKEHPFDFALWKTAKGDEIAWESPWGKGRPGWHIECSVMSAEYLGETFDIHGGGRDLIFPHHENEIAQSEAAHGATFANHWMHVGMVNVAEVDEAGQVVERKMSKSLGNFWTTRDVLKGYHPEAIRYFMHTTVYRNPITYSVDNLNEATQRVEYLYTTIERIDDALARADYSVTSPPAACALDGRGEALNDFMARLEDELVDDFNTPRALALIGEVARIANDLTESKKKPKDDVAYTLYKAREALTGGGYLLGFLQQDPKVALLQIRDLKVGLLGIDPEKVESLIAARVTARGEKDWAKADAIRDELQAMKVEIMDSPEGTIWRVA